MLRRAALTYLILGHVVRDLCPEGWRPGGTAVYAALAAHRLGQKVAVVTSAAADFDFVAALPGIAVRNVPAATTTVFENRLTAEGRRQRLLARARELEPKDLPDHWRVAPIVHLAPIADELSPELIDLFPSSLVGVSAQGWLRQWDAAGVVSVAARPFRGQPERIFSRADAVMLSDEDVGDASAIDRYTSLAKLLVVTRGAQGASVYYRGERRDLPAYPTVVVDPIGAGDVFAAAFLVSLSRGADPFAAADFANCAASFAVEQPGALGIPTEDAVLRRMVAR